MDINPTNLEAIGTRWAEETIGLASKIAPGAKSGLIAERDGGRFEVHIADMLEVMGQGVYPNSDAEIQPILEGIIGTRVSRVVAVKVVKRSGNASGMVSEADWFVESLTGALYRISYRKD